MIRAGIKGLSLGIVGQSTDIDGLPEGRLIFFAKKQKILPPVRESSPVILILPFLQ